VRRPAFTALDCSRMKNNFGILPKPWQASLQQTIGKIFSKT
jgi:dTDP-4-dehydrorhamnose reductase